MVVDSGPAMVKRKSQKGKPRWVAGYSREFPKSPRAKNYLLEAIPSDLWSRVRAKAKAEEVSLRTLILRLLSRWVS
jgi:hypothetical protein